jgi:DHA1 family multidrug resistance protein-like MFS transporter
VPESPQRAGKLQLFGILGVLLGVTMLMRASQNMAQTSFPLVAGELLHLHASVVGLVAGAMGAASVLTMVGLASRVPTIRAPQALVVAMLAMAISFPLIGIAHGVALLVLGVLVLGFGGGLAFPTLMTAVGGVGGDSGASGARDRPIALLGVALSVSLAIGPFVETGVLDLARGSLRVAFLEFGLGPLAAAVIMARVVRRRRHATSALSPQETPPARPRPSPGSTRGHSTSGHVAFFQAVADPAFRVALFGQLVYAAPFAAIVVFGALFARHDYGLSTAGAEIAFGVFFGVSFIVRSLLAWRSPILHKLGLFQLSTVLTVVGIVLIALGHGVAMLFVAMAILGVPHGLVFPLSMGLVAEARPHAELASINAHLSASVQAVNLILPLLLGVGIDTIGYRTMFVILVGPVLIAGIFQQLAARGLTAGRPPPLRSPGRGVDEEQSAA